jgi:signal transduction histidine kinase
MPRKSYRRIRTLMLGAFGLICMFLLLLELFEYREGSDTRRSLDLIEDNALTSVRLVGRLGADVDRERILIYRHIFVHEAVDQSAVERQIADVRADYEAAAREYSPLVRFPGEPEAWRQLTVDVTSARQQIEPALVLSRQNRDFEASLAMAQLDPQFEHIGNDASELIDINQVTAERVVERVTDLHRANVRVRLALVAALVVTVMFGGLWLTRAVLRTQGALAGAIGSLENRNRELDAFAGRVAHDLRGPLSTINLTAEVLAAHAPDAKAEAATIDRGIRKIANLIEDLLLLSRIDSMPKTNAAVETVGATLREDLGRLVAKEHGELRVELAPAQVSCSPGLLRQVLWNLGENAVKYRRPDVAPDIEIVGHVEAQRYAIRVADNGLGMSADDARQAFEPFFRGRATISVAGTGLGLSIVRRIVEACGGTVTLDTTQSRGTTFLLSLPLAQT